MKKRLLALFLCIFMLMALPFSVSASTSDSKMTNIGIGGGGSLCTPLIDPTNTNRFYVPCDMGGFYYSYDRGETWNRTESKGWLRRACITDNGTIFTGGYGVYVSNDHGKTLDLIYPKDPYYQVSRCGWNENLMLAKDFDNGYLSGLTASNDKVWFATTSWEGYFRLMYADHDGSNLKIFYSETLEGVSYDSVKIMMTCKDNILYYTFKNKLWKYDFSTDTITELYSGEGNLTDVKWIGDQLFLLDDTSLRTKILYTKDFLNWEDLMDKNTLPTTFEQWGQTYSFDWHFKEITGNNFNNIFLSFACDVSDGIMKFNGSSFEWVFDSMYKTRNTIVDEGWSYGCHGPFYGICADPDDDNFCIVTNTETLYTIRYANANDREVHTTHCTANNDGTFTSTGLDVQTTYSVKEDPFNPDHIIICTTDLGLQNSYNNGKSFRRMEITGGNWDIFNTCYDLHFDPRTEGLIYGLWSNRHDAPYAPSLYDKDWTQGSFAVSKDGGNTWDFTYSTGIPADAIPVKMSIEDTGSNLTIAVATFNRGFFISYDSGKTFVSLNKGMDTVEGLIWGEDIVLTEEHIYCLAAPYNCVTGYWEPAVLYDYNRKTDTVSKIDLGELSLVRSLTYDTQKGLYLNVIPTNHYEWFTDLNEGFWANDNGGIYHYDGTSLSCVFSCYNGIFHSGFAPDGTMYATEPYGKVYAAKNGEFTTFAEGLFTQLKNVSFSSDGDTLYVTTFGGGTYRTSIPAPEVPETPVIPETPDTPETPEIPETPEETCNHSYGYHSFGDGTHEVFCCFCSIAPPTENCADTNNDSRCDRCWYVFPKQITYKKSSSLKNGTSYLLVNNNYTLTGSLQGSSIKLISENGVYKLSDPEKEVTHWTYDSGKIYYEENGVKYYLSVNSSKRLYVTKTSSLAVTWTYSNNRMTTQIRTSTRSPKTTTYYLGLSGSNFSVSTRKSTVNLYELMP